MALEFEGASGNDHISCYDPSHLRNLTEMTLSAWIYPTGWGEGNYGRILTKEGSSAGWIFFVSNNAGTDGVQTLCFYRFRATVDTDFRGANSALSLNTWHHVAVTSSQTETKLFVDGVELSYVRSTIGSGAYTNDTNLYFLIGNYWSGTRDFDGLIEDARVYETVLPPEAIGQLYAARGGDGIVEKLRGRWPLNEHPPGTVTSATIGAKDMSNYKTDAVETAGEMTFREGAVSRVRRVQ